MNKKFWFKSALFAMTTGTLMASGIFGNGCLRTVVERAWTAIVFS